MTEDSNRMGGIKSDILLAGRRCVYCAAADGRAFVCSLSASSCFDRKAS